jgi:2-polyprenyl-3-methyl-5-hydroxy-6-metoxy-1,4-benzoquinol methylase
MFRKPANHSKIVTGGHEHFIDRKVNNSVKKSLAQYVKKSLKSIFHNSADLNKFNSIFSQCINDTKNRKQGLVNLKNILSKSKLAGTNAGREDKWRINKRIKSIKDIINKNKLSLKGPFIDIGCGDGSITNEINKQLLPENVNATCVEYGPEGKGFCKEVIRSTNISELKSNKYGFGIAFMSLHHIENVSKMVEEMSRVMKKDGIIIIREHDLTRCLSNFERISDARQFLDWIHIIYDLAEHVTVEELYGPDYRRSNYQPPKYWDKLFEKNKMQKIYSSNGKNWLCSYYAGYKKL